MTNDPGIFRSDAFMAGEQHNHHCMLTFNGFNWWILACRKNQIDVARLIEDGRDMLTTHVSAIATIDTRQVDWAAYAEAAQAWDFRREQ